MRKLLITILLCLMSLDVYALGTSKIILKTNEEIDNLENIVVTVEVDSSSLLGLSANLVYDKSKLNLISYKASNNFEITYGNSIIFDTYKRNNSKEKIGTLVFKATNKFQKGETTTIKLTDILVTDGNKEEYLEPQEVNVKIKESIREGLLTAIYIDNEKLENFDSRIKEYYLTITDKKNITISATAINNDITIQNTGNINIEKVSKIVVTAIDKTGIKEDYIINLNKVNSEKSNEEGNDPKGLKSLIVNGYDIKFDYNKFEYSINVSNDKEELEILAIPINKDSIAKINNKKQDNGNNKITIEVLEPNGETTTYFVNIIKDKNDESKVSPLMYILSFMAILLLLIAIVIVYKKKSKQVSEVENSTN